MAKKIQFKLEYDEKRITLLEDAQKGDYLDLDDLNFINNLIEQKIKEKENELKNNVINEFKNSDEYLNKQEQLQMVQNQNNDLANEIKLLKQKNENAINIYKNSVEYQEIIKQKTILEGQINTVEKEKATLREKFEKELELEQIKLKTSLEETRRKELLELNKDKSALEIKLEHLTEKLEEEKSKQEEIRRNAVNEFKASAEHANLVKKVFEAEQEIQTLEEKIKLKQREFISTKALGQELENWCFDEYKNKMSLFVNDSVLLPTTKDISGSKPDFEFIVYDQDYEKIKDNPKALKSHQIAKIILEMKTESNLSDRINQRKNESHLKKLQKDLENFEAHYGFLVTELESENNFVVERHPQYPKIYIVRPTFYLSLLAIFREIILKNADLIKKLNDNKIAFEDGYKILEDFEELKENIINNAIKNINNHTDKIIKASEAIKKEADKVYESAKLIAETHLNTVKNKIEAFKIKKITTKIDALNKLDSESVNIPSNEFKTDDNIVKNETTKMKE